MKLNNNILKLSKKEWLEIGKKSSWISDQNQLLHYGVELELEVDKNPELVKTRSQEVFKHLGENKLIEYWKILFNKDIKNIIMFPVEFYSKLNKNNMSLLEYYWEEFLDKGNQSVFSIPFTTIMQLPKNIIRKINMTLDAKGTMH